MMRARLAFRSVIALAGALMLSACSDPAPLYVDQVWISAASSPDRPSAAYFVIHGGEEKVMLQAVLTEVAQRAEMHESVMENGMMTMKPVTAVEVPAKGKVTFAPGGKHVMLFGLSPDAAQMGKVALTLVFSDGQRIIVDAVVQKPGDGAPASAKAGEEGEHEGHESH